MGIMVPIARMILREHRRKPITGEGLLIGRQTVPLTVDEAVALIREEGVPLRDVAPSIDRNTLGAKGHSFISDLGFFSLFSDVRLRTLDVSDYEGAEIVHDMHYPVPDELARSFDFIWNGSCLDNMFDPAQAMRSTARMLKPGGRVICMESGGSPYFNDYIMFSQAWFFDYFAINNFEYCKVYSCIFDPWNIWDGPFDVYIANDYGTASHKFPLSAFFAKVLITVSIAEASEKTTWDRMPVQYRFKDSDHDVYRAAFARFSAEGPMVSPFAKDCGLPGFKFLGPLNAVPGRRFPNEPTLQPKPYPLLRKMHHMFDKFR